ncbi:MAG: hypothetical protein ACLGJD_28740 [Gammaproteobacteria bacterium]
MARKAPRPPTAPARAPIKSRLALQRLAELASKPSPPDRMRREVEGMVKAWLDGAEEERRIQVRDSLAEMQGEIAAGIEAAAEMMDEIEPEDEAGRRHATSALYALRAAREALQGARAGLA